MPLNTEIVRDGEALQLRWDYTTLSCMMTAACIESLPGVEYNDGKTYGGLEGTGKFVDFSWFPIYYMSPAPILIEKGVQTLKRDHSFLINENGETLDFEAGDILHAYRTMK